MIKGINKQILEVTNPESPYFERIIFFVRPEGQRLSEKELQAEAEKYSKNPGRPPRVRKSFGQRLGNAGFILLGVGAGAALSIIMGALA